MSSESRLNQFITNLLFRHGNIGEQEMLLILAEAEKEQIAKSRVLEILMPQVYRAVDMRQVSAALSFRQLIKAKIQELAGNLNEQACLREAEKLTLELPMAKAILAEELGQYLAAKSQEVKPEPVVETPTVETKPDTTAFEEKLNFFFKHKSLEPEAVKMLYEAIPLGMTEEFVTQRITRKIMELGLVAEQIQSGDKSLKEQYLGTRWIMPAPKPTPQAPKAEARKLFAGYADHVDAFSPAVLSEIRKTNSIFVLSLITETTATFEVIGDSTAHRLALSNVPTYLMNVANLVNLPANDRTRIVNVKPGKLQKDSNGIWQMTESMSLRFDAPAQASIVPPSIIVPPTQPIEPPRPSYRLPIGMDEHFGEAARLVVAQQNASSSLVQRQFGIGYARAERIMEQLMIAGIVTAPNNVNQRNLNITNETELIAHLRDLGYNLSTPSFPTQNRPETVTPTPAPTKPPLRVGKLVFFALLLVALGIGGYIVATKYIFKSTTTSKFTPESATKTFLNALNDRKIDKAKAAATTKTADLLSRLDAKGVKFITVPDPNKVTCFSLDEDSQTCTCGNPSDDKAVRVLVVKRGDFWLVDMVEEELRAPEGIKTTLGTATGEGLRLRAQPNMNSMVLTTMTYNTRFVVLAKGNAEVIKGYRDYWYKVSYAGRTGWTFGHYTSLADPSGKR